jgi:hypothetical protein
MNKRENFKDYGDPEYPFSGSMNCGALYIGGGSKSSSSQATNTASSTEINDSRMAASEGSIVAGAGSEITVTTNDAELIGANNDAITRLANDAVESNADVARSAVGEVSATARDISYTAAEAMTAATEAATRAASDSAYSAQKSAESAIAGQVTTARDALNFGTDISRDAFSTVESIGFEGQVTARSALKGMENTAYDGQVTARSALLTNRDVTRDALDFGSDFGDSALNFVSKSQKEQNDLIRYTNEQFTSKLAANSGDAVQNVTKDIVKYGMIAVAVIGIAIYFRPMKSA